MSNEEELKKKYHNQPYYHEEVFYCIFENKQTFPPTISFLCRIKCANLDGGLVYATNPERMTYKEEYCDDKKLLNAVYYMSKRKILARENLILGWEGRKLNESRYS